MGYYSDWDDAKPELPPEVGDTEDTVAGPITMSVSGPVSKHITNLAFCRLTGTATEGRSWGASNQSDHDAEDFQFALGADSRIGFVAVNGVNSVPANGTIIVP